MKAKGGDIQLVGFEVDGKVLLPEYRGTKIVLDNKDFLKFRDGDILGKGCKSGPQDALPRGLEAVNPDLRNALFCADFQNARPTLYILSLLKKTLVLLIGVTEPNYRLWP
ncbi:hypothetical protein ACRRTK_024274 [Alexandromys fortis]